MSERTRLIVNGKPVGPLAYRGKNGCHWVLCTARPDGNGGWECWGWHCSYCDEPCSYQGHRCDASEAILNAACSTGEGTPK